jgi:3-hydroxyacyl-[acyl-carrier-protein] dehydratase
MLRQELRKCLRDLHHLEDGSCSARLVIPPTFTGFQGHFPENPVLPGFCLVQSLLVIVEAWMSRSYSLMEIVSAKFFAVVTPDMELRFDCRRSAPAEDVLLVKGKVTSGERKIADLTLRVASAAEET